MHQGFGDEKGMVPAFDEAPGHTTDSTSVRSPGCVGGGGELREYTSSVRVIP
jgi:hypothetical protein